MALNTPIVIMLLRTATITVTIIPGVEHDYIDTMKNKYQNRFLVGFIYGIGFNEF